MKLSLSQISVSLCAFLQIVLFILGVIGLVWAMSGCAANRSYGAYARDAQGNEVGVKAEFSGTRK